MVSPSPSLLPLHTCVLSADFVTYLRLPGYLTKTKWHKSFQLVGLHR